MKFRVGPNNENEVMAGVHRVSGPLSLGGEGQGEGEATDNMNLPALERFNPNRRSKASPSPNLSPKGEGPDGVFESTLTRRLPFPPRSL